MRNNIGIKNRNSKPVRCLAWNMFGVAAGSCFILLASLGGCNYNDTIAFSNAELALPADSSALFRFTKRYFVLVPHDTALFYGTRACTTLVNGVIRDAVEDSLYFRTITLEPTMLDLDDTAHYVYPQLYQYASSIGGLAAHSITRYFEKSDSATLQLAYDNNGILTFLPKNRQIVLPRTLILGKCGWLVTDSTNAPINNTWPCSPLITSPVTYAQGHVLFDGFSVAVRPIAVPQAGENIYTVNSVGYQDGASIKSYFVLSGEYVDKSIVTRVSGSIVIQQAYFSHQGLIDQNISIYIEKIFSDGSVMIVREHSYVARGPQGAKLYSEDDNP